jgi:hypothetical protein
MLSEVCPTHRGYSWSHHSRSRATWRGRKAKGNARSGVRKAKAALSEDESVQRGQRQYKGRCPCVRMYGAPATSAGTPRRLRAQEPRPATSIKAGAPASPAWGLRRTAVGRAPRATSTTLRAALPPRLASYNGTVGRASRARLPTPRQPTPLLSGRCLTSAGRPRLRGMLATEGPGQPEGYPAPTAQETLAGDHALQWVLCVV